ncbi:hypothetical protein FVEN_g11597 [Fusarium venenatum]|uniref:Uncharacterized protein n=1 Tax=Fusarium venenatum TaxID=56646 RepID=A0A2L2U0Q6_9HYPO|nr:uncharacterized protein FVRRES_03937 [Fusarium venenatum]KAG8350273.1 hypothetical protein FVEN_g11597 [Fusarium venenatum]KAH7003089.1 hypothetical protein EDB82DRAFT_482583 [Fusarium venenatum]CEI67425.1 unnamed protein product [Fusarium venenatum]
MSVVDNFRDHVKRCSWDQDELEALLRGNRGVMVFFLNNTQQTVTWSDSGCDHGERCILAPDDIAPGKWGRWALRSCGFQTGCEGWMQWTVDGNGDPTVNLGYDNPYYGSNSYSCSINSTSYTVDYEGGDGNAAIVKFILSEK